MTGPRRMPWRAAPEWNTCAKHRAPSACTISARRASLGMRTASKWAMPAAVAGEISRSSQPAVVVVGPGPMP